MRAIKVNYVIKGLFIFLLSGVISIVAQAQEQFQKRFNIAFEATPLSAAVQQLNQTQNKQTLFGLGSNEQITLKLKNVTFDQAMDSILCHQTTFKGYQVIDYGSHKNLLLTKSATSHRYFDREKVNLPRFHVGNRLPDSVFHGLITQYNAIRGVDLGTRSLTILMLWNVNCVGCIMEMPYLEKLQEKFNKQVQIIMLTKDSQEQLRELIMHSKNVRLLKLPLLTGENALPSLFEYTLVPTQVWLDRDKTIVYITKGEITDENHIEAFIHGIRTNIPELKDTLFSHGDITKPLAVTLDPLQQGRFLTTTYFAPHLQSKYWYGLAGQFFSDSIASIWRVRYTAAELYRLAYLGTDEQKYGATRVIYESQNPDRLSPDPITWHNYFDYELTVKRKISKIQFLKIMQTDLNNGLGLYSKIEKRMIPCFVLTKKSGRKLSNDQQVPEEPQVAYNKLTANKTTLGDAMSMIYHLRLDKPVPIINETNLSDDTIISIGTIDLDFEHRLEEAKAAFLRAGIVLTVQKRSVNCIIVKDNNLMK